MNEHARARPAQAAASLELAALTAAPPTAYLGAALAALNQVNIEITNIFNDAGFAPIEPAILQPADPLFDLYGEEIWERAFVVEAAGQPALCLRPDFTAPVAQAFLSSAGGASPTARYGYFGPVFRNPREEESNGGSAAPAQRLQAGIEIIGEADPAARDAEVFDLAVKTLKWCGCESYEVTTGDLAIMFSLLDALNLPETRSRKLKRHFWRPQRFQELLRDFQDPASTQATATPGRAALLRGVGALGAPDAATAIADVIALAEIPHVGVRSQREIVARLLSQAQEAGAAPLAPEAAALIEAVLAVKGPSAPALARLRDLCRAAQIDLSRVLDRFEARLDALSAIGVDVYTLNFDAAFGRNLAYYDGFVFEMRVASPSGGGDLKLGGGGRYDRLFTAMGAPRPISGVGLALWPEAIVAATPGGGVSAALADGFEPPEWDAST